MSTYLWNSRKKRSSNSISFYCQTVKRLSVLVESYIFSPFNPLKYLSLVSLICHLGWKWTSSLITQANGNILTEKSKQNKTYMMIIKKEIIHFEATRAKEINNNQENSIKVHEFFFGVTFNCFFAVNIVSWIGNSLFVCWLCVFVYSDYSNKSRWPQFPRGRGDYIFSKLNFFAITSINYRWNFKKGVEKSIFWQVAHSL